MTLKIINHQAYQISDQIYNLIVIFKFQEKSGEYHYQGSFLDYAEIFASGETLKETKHRLKEQYDKTLLWAKTSILPRKELTDDHYLKIYLQQ